jgi:hypothetical protein
VRYGLYLCALYVSLHLLPSGISTHQMVSDRPLRHCTVFQAVQAADWWQGTPLPNSNSLLNNEPQTEVLLRPEDQSVPG